MTYIAIGQRVSRRRIGACLERERWLAAWQVPPIKTVTKKLHHSQSPRLYQPLLRATRVCAASVDRRGQLASIWHCHRPARGGACRPPSRRRQARYGAATKREAGIFFSTSSQRAGRFFLGFYSRIFDHGCRDSKSSTPSARGPNPERCARLRRRRQRSVVPPPPAAACLSASRAPGSSYRVFKRPEASRLVGTRRGAAGLSARFENDTVDLARTPKETSL